MDVGCTLDLGLR